MQKSIRSNEQQLIYLSNKAKEGCCLTMTGNLWKKSLDTGKWQLRYFVLFQNLLFYYDCERAERPSGVAFLESSYCDSNVNLKTGRDEKIGTSQGHCFTIYYKREGLRQYDLRAETEEECLAWVEAINSASFSKLLETKQYAQQKQYHLMQILETEACAKWNYVQQIEELTAEVKRLKSEFNDHRSEHRSDMEFPDENEELKKIKKVQSFFRGWMCRRRWKQIVDEYIRSEHAESMRRRNQIVFGLVECEDEYVQQLCILVKCYLRPLRMAACSKKPIILHEDVNSIFLNIETVLFLHQFFVQGLRNKMDNWPTLQLGDLFDMLLPMLGIYQEYVRNHHFSLQVLAEYKQRLEFNQMLKRLEEKQLCEGRSLESYLTYPMYQIPRYIITLHELLAHTPHEHVDRKKLEYAKSKLEQLSYIMHDEVSETESIRKNLAIERMIVDGCDLLFDVNQLFVRQGTLIQVMCDKIRPTKSRLTNFSTLARERKEAVRQVFLFTNHLLITARTNNGKLRLVKNFGKVSLIECTLVEDTTAELFNTDEDDPLNSDAPNSKSSNIIARLGFDQHSRNSSISQELSATYKRSQRKHIDSGAKLLQPCSLLTTGSAAVGKPIEHRHSTSVIQTEAEFVDIPRHASTQLNRGSVNVAGAESTLLYKFGSPTTDYANLDFRLIWEPKNGPATNIWLVASTLQEKVAWCSDISQCIEQLHYGDILNSAQADVSSVTMPQSVRSDPKLFKDDVDIKFSQTLNSCKVPQIRYATVNRLLDRLTDARFLSIDFLNTFLLTYRVFTTGLTVIWALTQVLVNLEVEAAALMNKDINSFQDTADTINSNDQRASVVSTNHRLPVLEETTNNSTEEHHPPNSSTPDKSPVNKLQENERLSAPPKPMLNLDAASKIVSSPPPLIPRSPVFSGICNFREDPPLQLPVLPEPKLPSVSPEIQTRLAPLALSEVIPDDMDSTSKSSLTKSIQDHQPLASVEASKQQKELRKSLTVDEITNLDNFIQSREKCSSFDTDHLASPPNDQEPSPYASDFFTNPKLDNLMSSNLLMVQTNPAIASSWTALNQQWPATVNPTLSFNSLTCDKNKRLLENYLNQTIGESPTIMSTSTPGATTASAKSESVLTEDCGKKDDHNHPTISIPPKQNVNKSKTKSLLSPLTPQPKKHSSTNVFSFSPITETLDLATKLNKVLIRPQSAKDESSACQSLAKHTMIAALNYSGVFGAMRPLTAKSELDSKQQVDANGELSNQSPQTQKTLSDAGTNMRIKITKASFKARPTLNDSKSKYSTSKYDMFDEHPMETETDEDGCDQKSGERKTDEQPRSHFFYNRCRNNLKPESIQDHLTDEFMRQRYSVQTDRSDSLIPTTTIDHARGSVVSWSGVSNLAKPKRPSVFSCPDADVNNSVRASIVQAHLNELNSNIQTRAGAVVTSSRQSKRRSSNTAAAQAFAVATAGCVNPLEAAGIMGFGPYPARSSFHRPSVSTRGHPINSYSSSSTSRSSSGSTSAASAAAAAAAAAAVSNQTGSGPAFKFRNNSTSGQTTSPTSMFANIQSNSGTSNNQITKKANLFVTASCSRVLNVVRHWITKFPDDFQSEPVLKREMKTLLELIISSSYLMPNDQKAGSQLLHQLISNQLVPDPIDLDVILTPTQIPSEKSFDELSVLDISEQLTFLDFQIFRSIRSEELLNQSWMKLDKEEKAKNVLLVCKRFNEVSRLVVSEIISLSDLNDRVLCIEKWVAIADICRCMQNYNGVLQICSALVNSSIYRLRRTWERVSKQTKQCIDRLQMLVASDGRFKSMREALHRCDPPCIPYLGMYLTDLSFIEEGALNIIENNLVNFCKMRMIAHVIREIQQFHQTPYLINHRKTVTDYLLDPTRLLDEEQTYQCSLNIEPRQSINRQPQTSS